MKKYLLIILAFASVQMTIGQRGPGQAPQNRKQKAEQIKANKIAFITQRVELTSKEAQIFWPVYNAYSQELDGFKKDFRIIRRNLQDIAVLSEQDIQKNLQRFFEIKASEANTQQKYYKQFQELLGSKKTALLLRAENDFKKELLKMLKGGVNH